MGTGNAIDTVDDLLLPAADSARACLGCGTCTASCPAGRVAGLRIRRAVERAAWGPLDEVLADDAIWLCTNCITCTERCPRGVRIDELVFWARNLAWPLHGPRTGHLAPLSSLRCTGHLVPPCLGLEQVREKLGLSAHPPTAAADAAAQAQVRRLLSLCRLPKGTEPTNAGEDAQAGKRAAGGWRRG